ncbi:MAG TPA: hypothetical protein DCG28_02380 [Lachnospiraceae bacterium]|nr:hypothetical protein [Lachnospiraceae bacterium]
MNIFFEPYILDALCVLIIILFIAIGMKRGLIKSALSVFSSFIAFFSSATLSPYISALLRNTETFEILTEMVATKLAISGFIENGTVSVTEKAISSLNLPSVFIQTLINNNNSVVYDILGAEDLSGYIYKYIANMIMNIGVTVISYIIVYVGVRVIMKLLGILKNISIISQMDKIGGAIAGLLTGVFFMWILLAVLTLFVGSPNFNALFQAIQSSVITKELYSTDIFVSLVFKFRV